MGRQRRHSDGLSSNASSISSSPSSSISAPLRTHYTGNNVWGPLGSRVKLAAPPATSFPQNRGEDANGGKGDGRARRRRARPPCIYLDDDVGERTHLLAYATRHSYVGSRYVHDWYYHDAERERQWREQLVDQAFGKWPARLLNRHVSHACSRMVVDHSWSLATPVVVVASRAGFMLPLRARRGLMHLWKTRLLGTVSAV